jgi:hypothetical protein
MAKAGAPKKAKPRPKLTDKEQSERFKQTAREIGAEEDGHKFEKAFKSLVASSSKPLSRR